MTPTGHIEWRQPSGTFSRQSAGNLRLAAIARSPSHSGAPKAIATSPGGELLLVGLDDGDVRLWDLSTDMPVARLEHAGGAVAFSGDGKFVLTGAGNGTIRFWPLDASSQSLVETVKSDVPRCLTPDQRAQFHLPTTPPRWCYDRHLWPYQDAAPPLTWDEHLVSAGIQTQH
jgi:WD40 repeat protein